MNTKFMFWCGFVVAIVNIFALVADIVTRNYMLAIVHGVCAITCGALAIYWFGQE